MGSAADVGADEDLAAKVGFGLLLERCLQDLEVIGGGVGGGVAGTRDTGRGLARLGQVAEQGKKPKPPL